MMILPFERIIVDTVLGGGRRERADLTYRISQDNLEELLVLAIRMTLRPALRFHSLDNGETWSECRCMTECHLPPMVGRKVLVLDEIL